jgi:two-component system sensor histidine kinase UhpB
MSDKNTRRRSSDPSRVAAIVPAATMAVAVATERSAIEETRREDSGSSPPADPPRRSLLTTLFIVNGAVLALIVVLLSVTPITITAPVIRPSELILVLAAFVALMALHLVLLRRVLSPLQKLSDLMRTVDPARPGRRLEGVPLREAEVATLARAFNDMLDRLELERRESARVALAAQERERLRVARELHDEIGQSLTAVTLRAERAASGVGADPTAELLGVADDIRESLDDVRRIARELRPEALDDLGLVNALITLCSRMQTQSGLRIEREFARDLPSLSDETELVVYRVAQESLTNAARHARASKASVSLTSDTDEVLLRVADDGVGLPPQVPTDTAGLAGMRERALLAGGSLRVSSEPGRGTTVELRVPVAAP